jgi:hypothetical protein
MAARPAFCHTGMLLQHYLGCIHEIQKFYLRSYLITPLNHAQSFCVLWGARCPSWWGNFRVAGSLLCECESPQIRKSAVIGHFVLGGSISWYRKNSQINERNILSAAWTPSVTKPVAAQTLLQPHHQSLPGTQPRRISDSILRLGEPYLPLFLSWSSISALLRRKCRGCRVPRNTHFEASTPSACLKSP